MSEHSGKVLVVDDVELNLVAMQGLLRRDDTDILFARSGQEALELLLVHDVAVAIVDVQMPIMDGFELAELMRGVERTRHVPIIFLTAGAHDNERRFRGYGAGAVDFLYKPVEPEILRRKVDVFIQLWRQRQDLARQRDELRAVADEKSRLLEELRESEARFRTLADHMSPLAWMMDEAGSVYWYNRRWYDYTGTTFEEMQGWGWQAVHHPHHVERVVAGKRRALESGEPWEDLFPLRARDGSFRWFLARAVPIRDGQGRIIRWFGTNIDVTDQRAMEEQLRDREERLRVFAGQLEQLVSERTDELTQSQQQLRALATELNLTELRERKRLAAELHDHLAQMLVLCRLKLGQSKRIDGMVPACQDLIRQTEDVLNEALTYTRTLVADLAPPVLHDFGLAAALRWLREYMERHDLRVRLEAPDDCGDGLPEDEAVLLFQSVRELLINTSKHAECDAASVSLVRENGVLRIEVRDDGRGMDPLVAQRPSDASGFGLFSIRERMRALGGTFDLQSAPGRGTVARLTLPIGKPEASPEVPLDPPGAARPESALEGAHEQPFVGVSEDRPGAAPAGLFAAASSKPHPVRSSIRVLLVDDHAMVRQGLRSLLDSYPDVEVVGEAANGEEAVAAVEQCHPSLVVMDINMPIMNGIEATARIKGKRPQMTVIGLSVQTGGEAQEAMLKAGAAVLLTKEAVVDELYGAIHGMRVMEPGNVIS